MRAHAASGSLAYVKDGDVYVSAPDGSRAARVTTDGGYAWPSQADDGTLVAVRQTAENGRTPRRLHRFGRDGARLGAPLETVPVDNSYFVGPLAPAGVAGRHDGRLPLLQHRRAERPHRGRRSRTRARTPAPSRASSAARSAAT